MTTDYEPVQSIYTPEEMMKKRREAIRSRRKEKISRIVNLIPTENYFDTLLIPDTRIA